MRHDGDAVFGQRSAMTAPRHIVVLTTGGTIASRGDGDGKRTAQDGPDLVLGHVTLPPGVTVEAREIIRIGSYRMTLDDCSRVAKEIAATLENPRVDGVVVTHGTDTIEETAFLADLLHASPRPVVFTGAQHPADDAEPDGPRNLTDALIVATDPEAHDLGCLIVFGGRVLAAQGTRKFHTLDLDAFAADEGGVVGAVDDVNGFRVRRRPPRRPSLRLRYNELSRFRVDIVPYHPGADTTLLRASAEAGARGIVLEGTGAGNANPAFRAEVAALTQRDVVAALSTRVPRGRVTPLYTGGGGADLVAAGALPTGELRSPQARVLLTVLLASCPTVEDVRTEFAQRVAM